MTNKPTYEELEQRVKELELDAQRNDQTEEVLKNGKEFYKKLVDSSPDLIYRTDHKGKITFISQSSFRLSGYLAEEAIGLNMAEEVYEDPEIRKVFITELMQNGQVQNFETKLKRRDGSIWWCSTNAHLLKDADGNFTGVEGIVRDISERKQVEDALRESEERFRALSEASFEAIFLSEKGICIEQNKTAERIFGYSYSESIGKPGTDWIIPEDRELVKANMLSGCEAPYEVKALRKEGTSFLAEIQGKMMQFHYVK